MNVHSILNNFQMGDQKAKIIFFFATVTLLGCCNPVVSFFLPQVTRTDDAIIIDFKGSEYASPIQRKNVYGEPANPGFVPLPTFNPYAMMFQQPQQMLYNGWTFFYGHPSAPSSRQFAAEEEAERQRQLQIAPAPTSTSTPKPTPTPTPTPTPAPAIQCGRGPAKFPGTRSLIGERLVPVTDPSTVVVTAKKNAWPFMITLKNSAGVLFCAGSLISDTKVVTAAQCFEKMSIYDMKGVTILVGMTSLTDVQMTRRPTKIVLHSKFNAFTYANDIAILTMDSPVVISNTVSPVCVPAASADPDQYVDQSAIILGWGTADIKNPSTSLLQAKVGIVSNSECRVDANFGRYVSDTTVCVSSTEVFTCIGDVGGPVVILSSSGSWTLVGINSYTKSDCSATGLKTRVPAFKAWIDLYMN